MDDDIDWTEASCDFGLALLCQEMAALAKPWESLARPMRRNRNGRAPARRVRAVPSKLEAA